MLTWNGNVITIGGIEIMTASHFVLKNAFRYKIKDESLTPRNCTYDIKNGLWVKEENCINIPFIQSETGPEPQTKKCDRETGEDLKGT